MLKIYKTGYWLTSILIGILSIPLSSAESPKNQNELAAAQQWLAEGDYPKAFDAFQYHAQEKQNHLAQFTLALFYQQGWGIEHDAVLACRWFEKRPRAEFLQPAISMLNACKRALINP